MTTAATKFKNKKAARARIRVGSTVQVNNVCGSYEGFKGIVTGTEKDSLDGQLMWVVQLAGIAMETRFFHNELNLLAQRPTF